MNDVLKINFFDSINTVTAKNFINNLESLCLQYPDASVLTINISSPGGDVNVAVELFHFLRSLECKIQTINISCVNSAAILIYLAGDSRICHIGSTFYIHSISKRLKGIYDIKTLSREVKEMSVNTDIVATILEQRTKRQKKYWKKLMSKGCILKAEQALRLGIVSIIADN
ncbi:ATP-dependent Clp protease proteolytic subunit [Barnesiella viscericola]|uniref:ATP-dependent Clp protease proteolytic subunit n=1 Tax=Barnesiella viscericola TaxID=397865 RepID=UPI0025A3E53C|nr:ATP-dependent Clp protease proteolytic subunit [Barnesiella viscericola]MDM8269147.1 ATP-dependent Clp protease proteolytic subunit [Barnesiella viscericola]